MNLTHLHTHLALLLALAIAGIGLMTAGCGQPVEAAARYEADAANAICGLTDLAQLSNPMRVRHEDVLAATPERKRMAKEKIDPASPLGEILESAAHRRVSAASRLVMQRDGHCSAWKRIKRKDGRAVPDLTADVIAELDSVTPDPE